jgi:hypothetical protein
MITIKRYNPNDAAVWDAFVDSSKNGTFMLKRGYMDYHADRFLDYSLMFYNDEKLVALLPASIHGLELRSHGGLTYGGFVTDIHMTVQLMLSIFECLRQYLSQQGITELLYKRVPAIYYLYPSDEDLYALFRNDAILIRKDISTTIYLPDKICFTERRRRGVKKAMKEGLNISESQDFEQYIAMLSNVLSKYHNALPVHSAAELNMLAGRFPDNIKLYAAFKDGRMLAGVVMYVTNKVAHTQYIANSDEGRQCGALDAVMDYLINECYSDKEYFDFGISTEDEGRFLNEGLISQKQEFGGRGIVYDFYVLKI